MLTTPCPFDATPGARPTRLAGRAAPLRAVDDALSSLVAAEPSRPLAFLGRVGTGRTTMVHEAAKHAAAAGWAAAIVTLTSDSLIEHELARGAAAALLHRARRTSGDAKIAELLGVVRAYAAAHDLDLPIEAPLAQISLPGNRLADAGALFERMADGMRSLGAGCFLALDDLDLLPSDQRLDVLGAAGRLAEAGRSFLLAVTGLPDAVDPVSADIHVLGNLTPAELLDAVSWPAAERGVEVKHDTIAAIGKRTDGHPLFVQAFASEAWKVATDGAITPVHVAASALAVERGLRASFFAPVLDALSSGEVRFVRAVADAGPGATFAEVATRLGDPVRFDPATSRLAPVLDELLRRRVLYRDGERLAFALPFFERYVRTTD